jgi:hypothetical protein
MTKPLAVVADFPTFSLFIENNPKYYTTRKLGRVGVFEKGMFISTLIRINVDLHNMELLNSIRGWEFKDVIYLNTVTPEQREIIELRVR